MYVISIPANRGTLAEIESIIELLFFLQCRTFDLKSPVKSVEMWIWIFNTVHTAMQSDLFVQVYPFPEEKGEGRKRIII